MKKKQSMENTQIKISTNTNFKKTEIGLIPEAWQVKRLEEVGKLKYGQSRNLNNEKQRKYPIIGTGGIISYGASYLYDKPSVILGRKGSINNPIYIDIPFWAVDTTFYIDFNNTINPQFFYYLSKTINWKNFNEASGVPSLNSNTLKSLLIPLPPKEEQEAIAMVLSDFDSLTEALDNLIAKKKAIKQAAMQDLLTAKKRLPGFSQPWVKKKLGEILKYEQPTNYIVKSDKYSDNGLIPVLTAGKTFILGYTFETQGIYTNIPVIIFDDFTTATQFVNFPFKVKSSAMKFLTLKSDDFDLRFIYEKMQLIDYKISDGDHKRRWITEFQNIEISIPPTLDEQRAIAKILSDMDAEIEALEKKKHKYELMKQAAMEQLLTGKVRVKRL